MNQPLSRVLVIAVCAVSVCWAGNAPADETVELFEGMEAGTVDAKFFAANAQRANIVLKNLTDDEVIVQLPKAFAAVPVLAQLGIGFQGGGGGQQAGGQQGGGSQSVGGNAGGQQGGGQFGGQQGGLFRIAPNRSRTVKAVTVCLEHGKAEPTPKLAYKIVPLSNVNSNEALQSLCEQAGSAGLPQNTAQAVAWHLANAMSWESLAKINRRESRYLGNQKYFTASEIKQAKAWVKAARKAGRDSSDSYTQANISETTLLSSTPVSR